RATLRYKPESLTRSPFGTATRCARYSGWRDKKKTDARRDALEAAEWEGWTCDPSYHNLADIDGSEDGFDVRSVHPHFRGHRSRPRTLGEGLEQRNFGDGLTFVGAQPEVVRLLQGLERLFAKDHLDTK